MAIIKVTKSAGGDVFINTRHIFTIQAASPNTQVVISDGGRYELQVTQSVDNLLKAIYEAERGINVENP